MGIPSKLTPTMTYRISRLERRLGDRERRVLLMAGAERIASRASSGSSRSASSSFRAFSVNRTQPRTTRRLIRIKASMQRLYRLPRPRQVCTSVWPLAVFPVFLERKSRRKPENPENPEKPWARGRAPLNPPERIRRKSRKNLLNKEKLRENILTRKISEARRRSPSLSSSCSALFPSIISGFSGAFPLCY